MPANYLVCRRAGAQVLIPADAVLGVRELTVHRAPPSAPPWVAGLAVLDAAAVTVARVEPRALAARGTEERVVVLQRASRDAASLEGVVVDEVVELRAIACEVAAGETAQWCQSVREPAGAWLVDPQRLHRALQTEVKP